MKKFRTPTLLALTLLPLLAAACASGSTDPVDDGDTSPTSNGHHGATSSSTATSSSSGTFGATSSTTTTTTTTVTTATSSSGIGGAGGAGGGDGGSTSTGQGGADEGATCALAAVVGATPVTLNETFAGDDAVASSCDPTPTNVAWFTYTAPAAGDYRFTGQDTGSPAASTVLAVFDGDGCAPTGIELGCKASATATSDVDATLTAGQTVRVMFHTGFNSEQMIKPKLTVAAAVHDPGSACSVAIDVTGKTFPYNVTGTFDEDPTVHGTCDTTPNNGVWFSYTAPATASYQLDLLNMTTASAFGRLVVFDGAACSPIGAQISCTTATDPDVSKKVSLTQGQTIKILFHTDGETYPMVDPQIWITQLPPPPAGADCSSAIDVTTATFPFTATGDFDEEPDVGGSCDTTPTNAVWFKYTAATAGDYTFALENHTTLSAYSRLAVFTGASCSPLGAEAFCQTASAKKENTTLSLAAGQTVQILFHTDGDTYSMIDPTITVMSLGPTPPGKSCGAPIDISGVALPYSVTGTFDKDPGVGGSCDTTPTNAIWYAYSPTASGLYKVTATNNTTSSAFSRVAIFDGTACSPYGAEETCQTATGKVGTASAYMEAGKSYLILFHTDGDTYTMVDPTIDVALQPNSDGALCQTPADVTGATFPKALTGTFGEDGHVAPSCDATPTNVAWFSFTPASTATYTINLLNHTTTSAGSRVAVFTGEACAPVGAEVACAKGTAKSISKDVALTGGTTYLIAFFTDGDTYTMVNPQISISP